MGSWFLALDFLSMINNLSPHPLEVPTDFYEASVADILHEDASVVSHLSGGWIGLLVQVMDITHLGFLVAASLGCPNGMSAGVMSSSSST